MASSPDNLDEKDEVAEHEQNLGELVAHFDEDAKELLSNEVISRLPTAKQKAKIIEIAGATRADLPDLQSIITEHFPVLLTKSERENVADWNKLQEARQSRIAALVRKGKYNIPEKRPNEPTATQKQLKYLEVLGVNDKLLLHDLGKNQASELISQMVEARSKASEQVDSSNLYNSVFPAEKYCPRRKATRKPKRRKTSSSMGCLVVIGAFLFILWKLIPDTTTVSLTLAQSEKTRAVTPLTQPIQEAKPQSRTRITTDVFVPIYKDGKLIGDYGILSGTSVRVLSYKRDESSAQIEYNGRPITIPVTNTDLSMTRVER